MNETMLLAAKLVDNGPGYRYVRFYNLVPRVSNIVRLVEVSVIDTASGTNWCRQPGARASASSSFGGADSSANAIDGVASSNSAWASNGTPTPQWWMVDLGRRRLFDSIKTVPGDNSNQTLKTFVIQASIDGNVWDTLKTWSSEPPYTTAFGATEVLK